MSNSGWLSKAMDSEDLPTSLVLYRTPKDWRYAIYLAGVADGRLLDLHPSASEVEAQNALVDLVEDGIGRRIRVNWKTEGDDWWSTEVTGDNKIH